VRRSPPTTQGGRIIASEVHAVWKDGRIIPEGPIDWREDCRLRIERDPLPPAPDEDPSEDWWNSPEAIADWLAWYDSLQPLAFTAEEAADLRHWRRRAKEYTIAHLNEGIGGPGE
jgi:hypothetical protein